MSEQPEEPVIVEYRVRPGSGEWISYGDLISQMATWAMIPSAGPPAVTISKRVTVRPLAGPAPDEIIVAYRNTDRPGVLLCREHGDGGLGLTPLTFENLPYGGNCTWTHPYQGGKKCGRDVLAAAADRPVCDSPSLDIAHIYNWPVCDSPSRDIVHVYNCLWCARDWSANGGANDE